MSRPPAYFTPDWGAARESVRALARLSPSVAATGHGRPMRGAKLRRGLENLALHFDRAVPPHGRYVAHPALTDSSGAVVSVPPPVADPSRLLLGLGLAALALVALRRAGGRR